MKKENGILDYNYLGHAQVTQLGNGYQVLSFAKYNFKTDMNDVELFISANFEENETYYPTNMKIHVDKDFKKIKSEVAEKIKELSEAGKFDQIIDMYEI